MSVQHRCWSKLCRATLLAGDRVNRAVWIGLFACVLAGISASFDAPSAIGAPASSSPYRNLGTFARALAHVEMSYVGAVDQDALVHGAIRGMVRTLDPHSDYLDPDEYRAFAADTRGRFGGIGVEVDVRDGWLTITAVFPAGPAERAGLRVGDRFVSIDGLRARDMPIEDAARRMRGEAGSEVKLALRRDDDTPAIEVTLRREIIAVDAVEGRVLDDGHLYLRLRVFQETTARELSDVLDAAMEAARAHGGLRGMLLDLRDNPGGLVDQAVAVADEFLEEGVIVSTRGRDGKQQSEWRAKRGGTRPGWPLVVLVNGYSASAAEIVAGALRDHKRALIVGTRTFGKGSVQNVIELPDASALKLTTGRYYTPSGRSIQAEGIEPDVIIEQAPSPVREHVQGVSEASLERHLENEGAPAAPAPTTSDRATPRRAPAVGKVASFTDDFQARLAYQTLRAIALDRERARSARADE